MTSKTMPAHRKISLTAGLLYLLTFVSIPSLALYTSAKGTNYILGSSSDYPAIIAGVLEVIVALAGIATAVVLFPILKKQNESGALALVAARILESSSIIVGVSFISAIVFLHRESAGANTLVTSHTLAVLYDRIFLLSQSFMPGICDLILGILLYKSRLVPRGLSLIGIIGAPFLLASYIAVLFGVYEQHAAIAGLSAFGVALFEFSLGLWLVFKGFNPKAVASLDSNK